MKGKIRLATEGDILRILELFNSDANLTGNDNLEYNEDHIREYVTNGFDTVFVYELEGKVVAVAVLEFRKTSKYIYFDDLVVDEEYQRKGIASEIQKYIESVGKEQGMNLIFFFNEVDNIEINNFAEKFGFERGKKFYFQSKKL